LSYAIWARIRCNEHSTKRVEAQNIGEMNEAKNVGIQKRSSRRDSVIEVAIGKRPIPIMIIDQKEEKRKKIKRKN
tara:strand:+ start:990 stop:1214 length:225 start_codon:yes stop_codon:yes gene_type:complete